MADMNIINGKVFFENRLIEKGLSITDGKIVVIAKEDSLPKADKIIDAKNKTILPGGIDVHTHILDLIYSYRDDFITGTQAAASGGITTVLEMPLGIEGKTTIESFEMQLVEMKKKCLVDYGLIGAAGYNTINSIQTLASKGVVAFKTFMINAPEEEAELKDLAAKDDYHLEKIFSEIAKTGLVSCIHAENDAIISHTIEKLTSQNKTDFQAHTISRPAIAEDEASMRAMVLANHAKVKLNLVHMSSKNSFENIKIAKARGWDVTCEITPHHLFFTSEDGERIGSWLKVNPPIRSKEHQKAAWEALNDGVIDFVASDHSPYSHEEKNVELKNNNIFECGSGTPGLETMYPVMLDAVNNNQITINRLVEVIATNPAKRFSLYPRKGIVQISSDADLVIIDMDKEYTLKNDDMFTKSKITVFNDKRIKGKIEKTLVRGEVVFDNGDFKVKSGYGEFLTPLKKK
ncbi:MAG TPA: dihydroorotase [candidate division Zixibacteria bacterium]|nr:dihydroorotase [candidate division Zixibacteria bacterium]